LFVPARVANETVMLDHCLPAALRDYLLKSYFAAPMAATRAALINVDAPVGI
jgi:hypothetical protein